MNKRILINLIIIIFEFYMNKDIKTTWKYFLEEEFQKDYFKDIETFIKKEQEKGKIILPKEEDVFNIFNAIDFEKVKVIILGQDPYHGINQAHGLSFSVPKGQKIPPSLKNIYKELQADIDFNIPAHGNLIDWTKQGVFLLNAVLTVNAKEPASHKNANWETFTDKIIQELSEKRENLVFMLWGNFAKKKASLIDTHKHLVLEAAHPSPFSAYNGFFACKHFSKANNYLSKNKIEKIDWQIQDNPNLFNL